MRREKPEINKISKLRPGMHVLMDGTCAPMKVENIESCGRDKQRYFRITLRDNFHRLHVVSSRETTQFRAG